MKKFLFLFTILTLTSGCGMDSKKDASPKQPEIVCKSLDDFHGTEIKTQTKELKIERHFQKVVRKNKEGKVLSDREETVKSPTETLEFLPVQNLAGKVQAVRIKNITTCESSETDLTLSSLTANIITAIVTLGLGRFDDIDANGKTSVLLDMAPAYNTTKVEKGLNRVEYEFFGECLKEFPNKKDSSYIFRCEQGEILERGVISLNVNYEEKTLEGVKEITVEINPTKEK